MVMSLLSSAPIHVVASQRRGAPQDTSESWKGHADEEFKARLLWTADVALCRQPSCEGGQSRCVGERSKMRGEARWAGGADARAGPRAGPTFADATRLAATVVLPVAHADAWNASPGRNMDGGQRLE